MSIKTNNKNFNDKYYVLWFKIELNEQKKLDIIWVQSWKRRYLVVGHIIPNGIGQRIGLQKGDRLGYINGIIAPKIGCIDHILKNKSTIYLGILRKHCQQTLIMADCLIKSWKKDKYPLYRICDDVKSDEDEEKKLKHIHQNDDDDNVKQVRNVQKSIHLFMADSSYQNFKDPYIYDFLENHEIDKNCSMIALKSFCPRDDQQSTPNNCTNETNSSFLENKENYRPQFFNDDDDEDIHCMSSLSMKRFVKNIEDPQKLSKLVSHQKTYFINYPENMNKSKMDSQVKAQRALRNLENIPDKTDN